jgi:tetratricopeptide (TPR) repeat protein
LVFVVLIGAGVAAWYYQAMWLPQAQQWWAKLMPVQEEVDPMAAPRPQGAETEQASEEGQSSGYVLSAITEDKAAEETATGVVEEVPVTSETTDAVPMAPTVPMEPVAELTVSDDVKDVSNDEVMDETSATNNTDTETAGGALSEVSEGMMMQAKAPVTAPVATDTGAVSLAQARQAFWARDLVKAEHMYRELLKREPATADAWGELGNLYYGQAKWQKAAEAYTEAAIQLLDQDQYSQAMFLHYVVRGLDPAQAARIDTKVRAMQATPQG